VAVSPGRGSVGSERARLFVALELPEEVRSSLWSWGRSRVADLGRARLLAPEALHVTLCFLGSQPSEAIGAIAAACRAAAAGGGPVAAALGRAVLLPSRRPRVLAAELVDLDGGLGALQATLASALSAGGWYGAESRSFLAHVTVVRISDRGPGVVRTSDGRPGVVRPSGRGPEPAPGRPDRPGPQRPNGPPRGRAPAAVEPPQPVGFVADTVSLFRSHLGPGGSRYEPLERIRLGSQR
jgi:RNA 2',3'-cyclic 3'-phosphodiesterase